VTGVIALALMFGIEKIMKHRHPEIANPRWRNCSNIWSFFRLAWPQRRAYPRCWTPIAQPAAAGREEINDGDALAIGAVQGCASRSADSRAPARRFPRLLRACHGFARTIQLRACGHPHTRDRGEGRVASHQAPRRERRRFPPLGCMTSPPACWDGLQLPRRPHRAEASLRLLEHGIGGSSASTACSPPRGGCDVSCGVLISRGSKP